MTYFLTSQLRTAAELWDEIKNNRQPADRLIGNYFHRFRRKFGSRDRRFLSETIYALFRHKTYLETWARELKNESSLFMAAMAVAVEGVLDEEETRFIFDSHFPGFRMPPEFLRNLAVCELPREIPGELECLSVRGSFPLWLVEKWAKNFGKDKALSLIEASQERPPFTIRTNTLKISRVKLMKHFQNKNMECEKTKTSSTGLIFKQRANLFDSEEFRNGWFEVQDEGSQIVCEKIAPKPGETLWDVCAGGGGKALALAALMENKGRIVATDIRDYKLDELRKRAKRAGITAIFPADLNRMNEMAIAKKGFDKIVVDAPCSGTGTLRRNPDAKWKLSPEGFLRNHQDQVSILEKAVTMLKPGGRIFYITCSLEPEENGQTFREFLARTPKLKQVLCQEFEDGFFRLFPGADEGSDGFFLAIAENTLECNPLIKETL